MRPARAIGGHRSSTITLVLLLALLVLDRPLAQTTLQPASTTNITIGEPTGQKVKPNQATTAKGKEDINRQVPELRKLNAQLMKIHNARAVDWDAFERIAREKLKNFPELMTQDIFASAYSDFEVMMNHYLSVEGNRSGKAQALATEVVASSAPEHYRLQAAGLLMRLESVGKPVVIRFTALDGRETDSSKMHGKVVLIDFWAVHCPGCVADAPKLKAVYDKFHEVGFEIVGINLDEDPKVVRRFLTTQGLAWPEYFETTPGAINKFGQQFGIYGIPHLMLLDKKGCLRFDGLKADSELVENISKLLAEEFSELKSP